MNRYDQGQQIAASRYPYTDDLATNIRYNQLQALQRDAFMAGWNARGVAEEAAHQQYVADRDAMDREQALYGNRD